jgi:hypothetical protein
MVREHVAYAKDCNILSVEALEPLLPGSATVGRLHSKLNQSG